MSSNVTLEIGMSALSKSLIRVANHGDFEAIKTMGMEFIKSTEHISKYAEEEYIDLLIMDMLNASQFTDIILIGDGGMLMGKAIPFLFGSATMATEIAWYVSPDKRWTGLGKELIEAFEYWAKNVSNCAFISMGSVNDAVGEYYIKKGYELSERAYIKEL